MSQLMMDAAYEALLTLNDALEVIDHNEAAAVFLGQSDPTGMVISDLLDSTELEGCSGM